MTAEVGQAGRIEARRPADSRRFIGPAGAVFVPHPLIDEDTIAANVASGDWTEVQPDPEPAPRSRKSK